MVLVYSGNLESANLNPLAECGSPSFSSPTVVLGLFVATFTYRAVGFRYDHFSPLYDMAVLYWFRV